MITLTRREIAFFSITLVFGALFLGSVVFGWTSPGQNPPDGNVSAPINAGSGSQTKLGNLSVSQLTLLVASGTAPLVLTSPTKVANLNADLLDGLDASGFGDATLSNQNTLLTRIGTSTDAASLTPASVFAGIKGIINQVDAAYITTATLIGFGSAPACPGGWSEIVGQTAAGSIAPVTSISTTGISPLTSLTVGTLRGWVCAGKDYGEGSGICGTSDTTDASYIKGGSATGYTVAAGGSATTYTLYYRLCGLPG